MQPLPSLISRLVCVCRTGLLLVALCMLGAACDRHDATEVPESYGHGSNHQKNYTSHQIDSRQGSRHFSDTRGINAEQHEGVAAEGAQAGKGAEAPAPAPTANPLGIGH